MSRKGLKLQEAKNENMKMIEIKKLSFSYNDNEPIFFEADLSIEEGEKIALMGDSGKGKSTLLKLISSYEQIPPCLNGTGNSITIQSRPVSYGCPDEIISYLPQAAYKALFPWKTVWDNIYYPVYLKYNGLAKKMLVKNKRLWDETNNFERYQYKNIQKIKKQLRKEFVKKNNAPILRAISFCNKCIGEFNLTNKLKDYPLTLSGGEQKRLSVIMALSVYPKIVLLDEPFTGLDFKITEQLWKFLKRYFTENKTTVLLVTHSVDEATVMADKVFFLNKDNQITSLTADFDFNHYAKMLPTNEKENLLNNPGELLLHPKFIDYRKKIREEYEKECK
jgi:ABC-type nitrate/sulfonate/bicarbonate transport system ATPase subunit